MFLYHSVPLFPAVSTVLCTERSNQNPDCQKTLPHSYEMCCNFFISSTNSKAKQWKKMDASVSMAYLSSQEMNFAQTIARLLKKKNSTNNRKLY